MDHLPEKKSLIPYFQLPLDRRGRGLQTLIPCSGNQTIYSSTEEKQKTEQVDKKEYCTKTFSQLPRACGLGQWVGACVCTSVFATVYLCTCRVRVCVCVPVPVRVRERVSAREGE